MRIFLGCSGDQFGGLYSEIHLLFQLSWYYVLYIQSWYDPKLGDYSVYYRELALTNYVVKALSRLILCVNKLLNVYLRSTCLFPS